MNIIFASSNLIVKYVKTGRQRLEAAALLFTPCQGTQVSFCSLPAQGSLQALVLIQCRD